MVGLRERKKLAQRRRIAGKARQLFVEKGFQETTIDEIAAALDISAVTVFNYFGNKDGLLIELSEGWARLLERAFAQVVERATTLEKAVAITTDVFLGSQALPRPLVAEVLRVTLFHPEARGAYERARRAIEGALEYGQELGVVRNDFDAEFLSRMVLNLIQGSLLQWVNDPGVSRAETALEVTTFVAGVVRASENGGAPR